MRAQPFKVLVVDDDMNFRDLLQTLLEAEGYKVECAASFGEGLARAQDGDFDVVLTDQQLPGPSGPELLGGSKIISQLRLTKPHLPVILMTVVPYSVEAAVERSKLGAFGYIFKPCDPQEILDLISKAVMANRVLSEPVPLGEAVTTESAAPVLTNSRIDRIRDRLVITDSIIEGQKEFARFRSYLAGLRHDVRAQRNALDILMSLLRRNRKNPKRVEDILREMQSQMEQLFQTIRDFPFAPTNRGQKTPGSARESSGPAGPVPITAGPFLEEARDLFGDLAEAQSIQLKCDPAVDIQFLGDRQLLKRALTILIQNAAEAIGQDGTITLRARSGKAPLRGKKTDAAFIEVKDTGPGIPAEVQERLFHPFFSTKSHGVGLGLATAAWIVTENGGAIQFKTRLGYGTTFTVILPACEKA